MLVQPRASFKENLQSLPPIEGLSRIDLIASNGGFVASIENLPGKQGSLAVYQYLSQNFDVVDRKAAEHGLTIFAEHVADAQNRPGAHPNIDLLLDIVAGGADLSIRTVSVDAV